MNATTWKVDLWINGADVPTKNYQEVIDPGRLTEVVGMVAQASANDVDQAVKAAHQAFNNWRKVDVEERCQLLLKALDILEKNSEKYATLLTRETGALYSGSIREIGMAKNTVLRNVEIVKDFLQVQKMEDEHSILHIEKVPIGVVAALIPWNIPIAGALIKVAPIILTGNTIVLKPSPTGALASTLLLKEISKLFPPGVINVVNGDSVVGEALTTHPLVRKITLTGGAKTAKQIMKSAAGSLKRLHFELGGNDAAIILDDADLKKTIQQITALSLIRTGQVCVAAKRIFVPKKMYKDASDLFIEYMNQYKVGYGLNENATLGPVNNKRQYDFVNSLILESKSVAEVMELGTKLEPEQWDNGYYIRPTLVLHAKPEHSVVAQEQFGPVIPLLAYELEEEMLEIVNDTNYGLGSTVWTSDLERGLAIGRQIEAGMTGINGGVDCSLSQHSPLGGVKESGIGWERGEYGLSEYINYHSYAIHKNN